MQIVHLRGIKRRGETLSDFWLFSDWEVDYFMNVSNSPLLKDKNTRDGFCLMSPNSGMEMAQTKLCRASS